MIGKASCKDIQKYCEKCKPFTFGMMTVKEVYKILEFIHTEQWYDVGREVIKVLILDFSNALLKKLI